MSVIQTTDGDDLVSVGLHTQAGRTDCKTSGRRGGEVMWSDEPPESDCHCWLKRRNGEYTTTGRKEEGGWWIGDMYWSESWVINNFQYGPRIPTPEEMEAERRAFNEALELIIELRRELAELKKGGG